MDLSIRRLDSHGAAHGGAHATCTPRRETHGTAQGKFVINGTVHGTAHGTSPLDCSRGSRRPMAYRMEKFARRRLFDGVGYGTGHKTCIPYGTAHRTAHETARGTAHSTVYGTFGSQLCSP